jgi:hypothetical protein
VNPRLAAAVDAHVRQHSAGARRMIDKPPGDVLAAAGLLTAAADILHSPGLAGIVARHVQAGKPGRPSKSSWARLLGRHHSSCSPALREAAEPATRACRRITGPHGPKAPPRAHPRAPGAALV